MMAFIEDITRRHRRIVEPAQRRLRHYQCMVGYYDARVPCRSHILFDKTATEMRAGRMDAFAAAVGE
jgi:hypothetical protein